MKGRDTSPAKTLGLFSSNYKLGFSTGFTLGNEQAIFSFSGPKEEVKRYVREILYSNNFVRGSYGRDIYFEKKNEGGAQYNIFVPLSNITSIVNILWYIGKKTGNYYDEKFFWSLGNPKNELISIYYDYDHKIIPNAPVLKSPAYLLFEAALAAKKKQNEELPPLNTQKPEEKEFWTQQELDDRTMGKRKS